MSCFYDKGPARARQDPQSEDEGRRLCICGLIFGKRPSDSQDVLGDSKATVGNYWRRGAHCESSGSSYSLWWPTRARAVRGARQGQFPRTASPGQCATSICLSPGPSNTLLDMLLCSHQDVLLAPTVHLTTSGTNTWSPQSRPLSRCFSTGLEASSAMSLHNEFWRLSYVFLAINRLLYPKVSNFLRFSVKIIYCHHPH